MMSYNDGIEVVVRICSSKKRFLNISQILQGNTCIGVSLKKRSRPLAASEINEQQQLSEGFANSCYKIVSPILLQELIKDSALCRRCSETFTLKM